MARKRDDRPRGAAGMREPRRRQAGRREHVDARASRALRVLHRRARGGQPVGIAGRRARIRRGREHRRTPRRRCAARRLRAAKPYARGPHADDRGEHGGDLAPPDDALGRHLAGALTGARQDSGRRRVEEGRRAPLAARAIAVAGARPHPGARRGRRAARARAGEVPRARSRRDHDPEVPLARAHQGHGCRRYRRTLLRDRAGLDVLEGLESRLQEDRSMSDYLDPTDSVAVPRQTATRPASLDGKVVTLLDISKAQGNHLLDRIEELLRERTTPKAIIRKKKPTFARPAPDTLRKEIVGVTDVLVEGLAD